jgi:hypothetical protein
VLTRVIGDAGAFVDKTTLEICPEIGRDLTAAGSVEVPCLSCKIAKFARYTVGLGDITCQGPVDKLSYDMFACCLAISTRLAQPRRKMLSGSGPGFKVVR